MSRDSNGTYTRPSNGFTDPVTGTPIAAADATVFFNDIDTELTDSLSRSGKGGMSADLDMSNNDINNLKTAVFKGSTSGNLTVQATAIAGTNTLTLPASTDTVATLTNIPWRNTRLAKTGAYVATNSDKGSTVALGGTAFYTLTMNAASGYDSDYVIIVTNEDSTRGKTIACNGLSDFILWPLQSVLIFNQNNVWQVHGRKRWKLPTNTTFYVNHASGSATSDGLSTGSSAFATIQGAINILHQEIDFNAVNVTIQLASETFTENNVFCGGQPLGYHVIYVVGDTATPSNVVWQVSSGAGLTCRDYGIIDISGVKMVATASGCTALAVSQFGIIDYHAMEFGAFASGYHIDIDSGSVNWTGGSYAVSGNFSTHWRLSGNARLSVNGATINLPSALTFTNWLQIQGPGMFNGGGGNTFTGTGAGAGSTGQKYNITYNGVAFLGGATLPGATAGATGSGGQVL